MGKYTIQHPVVLDAQKDSNFFKNDVFCQAQPQLQLQLWLRLDLISISPHHPHPSDLQIMVYSILVTRKFLASQKIFSESTDILSRKWTFDGNYRYFCEKLTAKQFYRRFIFLSRYQFPKKFCESILYNFLWIFQYHTVAVNIIEYFLSCQWKQQKISARLISVCCSNSDILKWFNNRQCNKKESALTPCRGFWESESMKIQFLQFYGSIPWNCIFPYVSVFCRILKHFE